MNLLHVVLQLLYVCLLRHVVVLIDVELAHFHWHGVRVQIHIHDLLGGQAAQFKLVVRFFKLDKVALLSHNPGQIVDTHDEFLSPQEPSDCPLNVHYVRVDNLGRA